MRYHAVLTLQEMRAWLAEFMSGADRLRVEDVEGCRVTCTVDAGTLEPRPGGTISGPAMFWAADLSGFLAVSALIGRVPSVTLAQSSMSFLQPAEPGALRVVAEVISLASRSAVVTALVSDVQGCLVAFGTLHFALPSRAMRALRATGHPGVAT